MLKINNIVRDCQNRVFSSYHAKVVGSNLKEYFAEPRQHETGTGVSGENVCRRPSEKVSDEAERMLVLILIKVRAVVISLIKATIRTVHQDRFGTSFKQTKTRFRMGVLQVSRPAYQPWRHLQRMTMCLAPQRYTQLSFSAP